MTLLIDIGNTQIKWAIIDQHDQVGDPLGQWVSHGVVSHDAFENILASGGHACKHAVISHVASQDIKEKINAAFTQQALSIEWVVSKSAYQGVHIAYDFPTQLGSDRFAALIGARHLFPHQTQLVVLSGTALTIDVLKENGECMGGLIAPGLYSMAQSLSRHTAQLPHVNVFDTLTPFATNTESAIASGCLAAQIGAIDYAWKKCTHTLATSDAHCILSGGGATYIQPYLTMPYQFVNHLVLIGLQVIARCSK